MAGYTVRRSAPKGHTVPPLLLELVAWVKQQPHGSLGWFDAFGPAPISKHEEQAARLRKHGFGFLSLPEGSVLALLETESRSPAAVVLLGSEGERVTVANSFEAFLRLWSKGQTGLDDLDDEDAAEGRAQLSRWLKAKKLRAPKAKDFDFAAWLDGDPVPSVAEELHTARSAPNTRAPTPTSLVSKLGPKARELAALLGRRIDDPQVVHFVTKVLAKKLIASTSETADTNHVVAAKAGIVLSMTHVVPHDAFPPIHKTSKSFVPYVTSFELDPAFGEPVLGIPWSAASEAELTKILGPATPMRLLVDPDERIPEWTYPLDTSAHTQLTIWLASRRGKPRVAIKLSVGTEEPPPA